MMTTRNDTCDWQALHSEKSRMLNQQASKSKNIKIIISCKQCFKSILQKVPFFCTRLRIHIHPKGRLLSYIIFYFLMYWFANFVCKESRNLSPFGKVAILGLDINQRTLNLKFSWPFFSDALASSRAARLCAATVTFLSLFSLDFVKMCFKTIFDDLVCGFISF